MFDTKALTLIVVVTCFSIAACNTGATRRNPGKIYAPDMTYSRAYDAYTYNPNFADSQTSRRPVNGTIARGHEFPDRLAEGDTTAYKTFTTAMRFNENELTEGKRLYTIYCGICHGQNLDGNGPLYNGGNGKFAAAPANFKDARYLNMPVGTMYAAVKYGKNSMGSYASQLDIKQRWQVIAYIKQFQSKNGGAAFAFGTQEVNEAGQKPSAVDTASKTESSTVKQKG